MTNIDQTITLDEMTTPDEARELLDGTTPGEEWYYRVRWGRVHTLHPVGIDRTFGLLKVTEPDAALIAAASKMAHTLAGMREEWGVSCGGKKPGAWWASREEADQCAKRMSIGTHYERPIVVVRRYVTEAMEA